METEIKEEGVRTCQPTEGQRLKKRLFLLFLATDVLFIAGIALYWVAYVQRRQDDRPIPPVPVPKYIAHAGGGIGKMSYTNSRDAFDANYRRGHRCFELDLNWTSDGQLVLIHDWEGNFRDLFPNSKVTVPPSLDEFLRLTMRNNLTPLSFAGLADWLRCPSRRDNRHRREGRQPPGPQEDRGRLSRTDRSRHSADLRLRGVRAGLGDGLS